jgi:hypothetical protein
MQRPPQLLLSQPFLADVATLVEDTAALKCAATLGNYHILVTA